MDAGDASSRLTGSMRSAFLAADLAWGLSLGDNGYAIRLFFLGCIVIAGVTGAITASRRILYVQAMPAARAIVFTYLSSHP